MTLELRSEMGGSPDGDETEPFAFLWPDERNVNMAQVQAATVTPTAVQTIIWDQPYPSI